ncbi:hypothetical protein EEL32_20930 [Brevibacillus laterosporus]|nr:hypothetical protein [Brevibacillus laterosporus]TPG80924.1 hypothetical protein EEL32_20930 [Brevibacillus laterosporus]
MKEFLRKSMCMFCVLNVFLIQQVHVPTIYAQQKQTNQQLKQAMEKAATFIRQQQDEQGAMNESGYINTDSNMLYAMMGLLAAYDLTGKKEYLETVERGMQWLVEVQNREGDWYLSYKKEGKRYLPTLPVSYSEFAAIRGVDTTMALFIHVTSELKERSSNKWLIQKTKIASSRAYTFLIRHNRDTKDGLFWSSYQKKKTEKNTNPTELSLTEYDKLYIKFAADNAETYIGLRAYAKLYPMSSASVYAKELKENFSLFYDDKEKRFAVMLDKEGKRKMNPPYAEYFATGWSAYLMQEPDLFTEALISLGDKMKEDGSFKLADGTYALSSLSFLLGVKGVKRIDREKVDRASSFLFTLQQNNGGIADDIDSKNTYVNMAGIFLLYVVDELRLKKGLLLLG